MAETLLADRSLKTHRAELEARVAALPVRRVILASTARSRGGVWRNVRDLGLLLQNLGLDVQIALPEGDHELQKASREVGLAWGGFRKLAGSRGAVWHVHLHNTYDVAAFAAILGRRFFGPTVITEHLPRNQASDARLESHHPRTRGAQTAKTVFKYVEYLVTDELIAVGTSSAQFVHERYGRPLDRIRVVHNGIATPEASPIPVSAGRPLRILAIGSLGRQKGFDVLINAVPHSVRRWTVTIAGDGFQMESLRALSAAVAQDRVDFSGWVDNPHELMRKADIVCMPSRWESFPYVALESLALCRPVVGSRVDGLDEIVDDDSGVLVEPDRPEDLARALDQLDENRARLEMMAAAGPGRAAQFTVAKMLFGTLDAYDSAWQARRQFWTWGRSR